MKIKNNKRIVMFEVSDDHESRKHEHSGKWSGGNYKKPFADFIESLGFEVKVEEHLDRIVINGHNFDLYVGNATYMTKNSYTRVVSVRKPINRYVSIMKGHDSTLLKIHFNKEYDGDKLYKTINDEIQRRVDAHKFHEEKKNEDRQNTIAVAEHFMIHDDFKNIVERIKIHQGEIQIMFDGATLTITPNKHFLSLDIYSSEIKNESELNFCFDKLITIKENTNKLLQIVKQNEFQSNIIEWCKKTYHRYYDVKELKYSEH
jgi:hypothetical protein